MLYNYSYQPAPPQIEFHGTQNELARKLRKTGLVVLRGGRGSYILGGHSSGIIYEYADKNSTIPTRMVTPSKDMMRLRYGKDRITENDYARLTKELNNGTILFESLSY